MWPGLTPVIVMPRAMTREHTLDWAPRLGSTQFGFGGPMEKRKSLRDRKQTRLSCSAEVRENLFHEVPEKCNADGVLDCATVCVRKLAVEAKGADHSMSLKARLSEETHRSKR